MEYENDLIYIKECIEQHKFWLSMGEGWDGENAKPPNIQAFNTAAEFLRFYTKAILNQSGKYLAAPSFRPLSDGSFDLHWSNLPTCKFGCPSFIFCFTPGSTIFYSFGYDKEGKSAQHQYNIKNPTNQDLLDWMQLNLTI